jgi:proteasome lid subunit RPN8/RPN11
MSKEPWLSRAERFIEGLRKRITALNIAQEQELMRKLNDAWDLIQDDAVMHGDLAKREIEWVAQTVASWEERSGIIVSKKERKRRRVGIMDFFRKDNDNDSIGGTEDNKGNLLEVTSTSYDTPSMNTVHPDELLISINDGKNEVDSNFKVYIKQEVYNEVMTLTKLLDDEITGLLEVEREGENFTIKGLQMFRQKVSKTQCEQEDDMAIQEMCKRMIAEGKNPAELKCWWHSHNNMGVSPSGTDYDTIKKYGVDYAIMIITNHSKEISCQVHIFKPFQIKIKNVPVYIVQPAISQALIDKCVEQVKTFVKNEHRSYSRTVVPISEERGVVTQREFGMPPYGHGYGYDYHNDMYGGY